jgi:hypothetical protein
MSREWIKMLEQQDHSFGKTPLTPEFELAIMHFWAAATELERQFSRQEIEAIPALSRVIHAAHKLPAAIGWHDVRPQPLTEAARVLPFSR